MAHSDYDGLNDTGYDLVAEVIMPNRVEIFPWNENFSTGIDIIDEQHQQLLFLINKLAEHTAGDGDLETLQAVIQELSDYVKYHFRAEEEIMVACFGDDPSVAEHLASHHGFEAKIHGFELEVEDKTVEEVMHEALAFLVNWLVLHILDTDTWMTKVVLYVRQGVPFDDAKLRADAEVSGPAKSLVETILAMYDDMTSKSLHLMQEIIERKKVEKRLQLAGKVIENTLEAIFITDGEGVVIDVNPSFCSNAECDEVSVTGQNIREIHPALNEGSDIWKGVEANDYWVGETSYRRSSGETVTEWLNLSAIKSKKGKVTHYVGVFSNVSQLLERQKDLHHIANHDALTGLPNRMLLSDRLAQEIKKNHRHKNKTLLVLFIDLDGFKAVNDTFGHDAGDEVLIQTAERFSQCVRSADTVARLGGDEFVILLPNLYHRNDAIPTLDRLLHALAEPVLFNGHELKVTLSIGVAACPGNTSDVDELLLLADKAMYSAKQSGKNKYHFHEA